MARSGLVAFGAIALLPLLLYGGCHHFAGRYERQATTAHTKAGNAFLADLPQTDCLRSMDIIPLAQARGWQARDDANQFSCIRPDTIQSWLRIIVDPPLPFSTEDENSHIFGFDKAGCAVDWSYASGPGTTCPD